MKITKWSRVLNVSDFGFNIARWLVKNTWSLFKFGAWTIWTSETIIRDGGDWYGWFLTSPVKADIVSSSANDTANGTGARSIIIYWLDGDNLEQSEVITLNWTTIVQTIKTYNIIFRALVLTWWSAWIAGVNGANQWDITITKTGWNPATTLDLFAKILQYKWQTLMTPYRVPSNKTLYVTGISWSVWQWKSCRLSFKFRNLALANNGAFSTKYDLELYENAITQDLFTPLAVPGWTDIIVTGKTWVSTVDVTASFGGILVAN